MLRWPLLSSITLLLIVLFATGTQAVGLAIEAEQVVLDFGAVTPGQPLVIPRAIQLAIRSESLWHLSIHAQDDLRDVHGYSVPAQRLSWALANDEQPQWHALAQTEQTMLTEQLPTGQQVQTVAVDLRLNPAWTDTPGGPFHTNVLVTLAAGADLVPSYTWPQPYIPGVQPLVFTFFMPSLDASAVCLHIYNNMGDLVAQKEETATKAGWTTISWVGDTLTGESITPDRYTYSIINDGNMVAHGVIEVVAAPQAAVGQISGYVNAAGAAIGASVLIYDQARRLVASVLTDAAGYFDFTQLPTGVYWLEVNYPGYITWTSPLLAITQDEPHQHVVVSLTANNALFVTATLTVNGEAVGVNGSSLQAGDLVEVSGEVRNTGTRLLRWPVLEALWPLGCRPIAQAIGQLELVEQAVIIEECVVGQQQLMQQLELPDLAPGAKVTYRLLAVVELPSTSVRQEGASGRLLARASAVQPGKQSLLPVQSPPRIINITTGSNSAYSGGMLILYIFWDENGDGQVDPNEAPAALTCFTLSDGRVVSTDSSGWLRCPVTAGPITLYLPGNQVESQVAYAGLVPLGGLLTGQVGLRKENATQRSAAVLGMELVSGTVLLKGAGILAHDAGSWHLAWQPPYRFSGIKMNINGSHQWNVTMQNEQPALSWTTKVADLPGEGRRPAAFCVTVGVSGQPAWQKVKWHAPVGSGPFNFPTTVAGVRSVVLHTSAANKELSLADYTWSPTGQLWLATPISQLVAAMAGSEPVWLEAFYIPANDAGQAQLTANYQIDMRAIPERNDADGGAGAAMREEFRLQWQRTPGTNLTHPSWLLTWTREWAGTRWCWQGGNTLPGSDNSHVTWPLQYKIAWEKTINHWQLQVSHQRMLTDIYQVAALRYNRQSMWPGSVGITLLRHMQVDAASPVSAPASAAISAPTQQLKLRVDINPGNGRENVVDWQWQGRGLFADQMRFRVSGEQNDLDIDVSGQWQTASWYGDWHVRWDQPISSGHCSCVYAPVGSCVWSEFKVQWQQPAGFTATSLSMWRTKRWGENWQLSGQLRMENRYLHNWAQRSFTLVPALTIRWQKQPQWALAVGSEWPRLWAGSWQQAHSHKWVGVEWRLGYWWINLQLRNVLIRKPKVHM